MGVNLLVSDPVPIEWSSASVQLTLPEISHDARLKLLRPYTTHKHPSVGSLILS